MGIPLYEFLNVENKAVYYSDLKKLWPDNDLSNEIKDAIVANFYERLTYISPPSLWLYKWQNFIKRRTYAWNKLLNSEKSLRDDDAIYNYDMQETSNDKRTIKNNSTTNGETTTKSTNTAENESFASDTPDGSLSDIANYMSSGEKNSTNSNSNSTDNNTTKTTGDGEENYTHTLTRKGNIGVMTSAQIIGGYRDAIKYNCFDTIFAECEAYFIGVYEEDNNGYFYPTY